MKFLTDIKTLTVTHEVHGNQYLQMPRLVMEL